MRPSVQAPCRQRGICVLGGDGPRAVEQQAEKMVQTEVVLCSGPEEQRGRGVHFAEGFVVLGSTQ